MSSDEVLDKADALMRRHRSFVARDANAPLPAAEEALPDIPLLTEKVDADDTPSLSAELVAAAENELARWLEEALPDQIAAVQTELAGLLRRRIEAEVRATLLPRLETALTEALARKT